MAKVRSVRLDGGARASAKDYEAESLFLID